MKTNRYLKTLVFAGLFLALLALGGIVYAASHAPINHTPDYTGSNTPQWLGPGWRFWASTDTQFGEVVCVEVHPQGDSGNYVRAEGVYNDKSYPHDGHTDYEYRIDVFTGGIPDAFKNKTVEYQFFVDSDSNNCSGGSNFTGFNWTFYAGPAATQVTQFRSRPYATVTGLGGLGLLGLAGFLYLRRRRR